MDIGNKIEVKIVNNEPIGEIIGIVPVKVIEEEGKMLCEICDVTPKCDMAMMCNTVGGEDIAIIIRKDCKNINNLLDLL